MEKKQNDVFKTLNGINVNEHTEKKKNGSTELTYLSWAWAWAEVMKKYPDAEYTIFHDEQHRPYIEDPVLGIMCMTTVTINGQTREMWLPVMDGANKAMKREAYTYKVWNRQTNRMEEKTVAAATMFDINKTIMRCLVKNLAMFGLGLYIYAGEDLPENVDGAPASDGLTDACGEAWAAMTIDELKAVYSKYEKKYGKEQKFLDACTERKNELKAA